MTKGIFWLSAPNQNSLSDDLRLNGVNPVFGELPKHFHVTLQFGVELTPEIESFLGQQVEVQVVANCFNSKIQALKVELPSSASVDNLSEVDLRAMCRNAQPHLTLSMAEGAKPVESNDMFAGEHDCTPVSFPLMLQFDFFAFNQ
jgi:hypothetical protein